MPDHLALAEMLGFVAERLMALDVGQLCGAGAHERTTARTNHGSKFVAMIDDPARSDPQKYLLNNMASDADEFF